MDAKTSKYVGLLVFIPIIMITGYLSSVLVDMVGITGYLVTIVTNSLLFVAYAWVAKVKIEPTMFFVFFVMALGSSMLGTMLIGILDITDTLIQTLVNAAVLSVTLFMLAMTPKSQQKPPQSPVNL